MREAPQSFSSELARIGGLNSYGEPIFKLVWSTEPRMMIGGRFPDSFEGYRWKRAVHGEPCWALMVWEPAELYGSPDLWEWQYRDPETGWCDCGPYPQHGQYRLLSRYLYKELVNGQVVTYRLEPCGMILDLMMPMLKAWRRLSDAAKIAALKQEEQLAKDEFTKKAKDLRHSCKISRSSQLVQKRAEQIEKGMQKAMEAAVQWGLGMRVEA